MLFNYSLLRVALALQLRDEIINLTQLRCNVRSRVDKKSGRKAPRPEAQDCILLMYLRACLAGCREHNCLACLQGHFFVMVQRLVQVHITSSVYNYQNIWISLFGSYNLPH